MLPCQSKAGWPNHFIPASLLSDCIDGTGASAAEFRACVQHDITRRLRQSNFNPLHCEPDKEPLTLNPKPRIYPKERTSNIGALIVGIGFGGIKYPVLWP